MQNKGAIRLFAILLALACVFYMSFTWKVRTVENDAKQYAENYVASKEVIEAAKKATVDNPEYEKVYLDSIYSHSVDHYLDSLRKLPIYNILITQYTYEDCKEKEINLGLDLRGGMNVVLEVSVPDIIRQMSNNSNDPVFNKAIAEAQVKSRTSDKDFVTLFGEAFKTIDPNARLSVNFLTLELKGKVDINTSDEVVLKLLRDRVTESLETTKNTLEARINKFGVAQPNIQKLEGSGRIAVELPGVKDKERVRKLLQGTANLEFWETHENKDIYQLLVEANKRLKEQAALANDSTVATKDSTVANDSTAVALKVDSAKKDTSATSLTSQLKKDTAATATSAAKDTSLEAFKKENPLFSVLRPALYQDQQNNYQLRPGPVVGYSSIKDTGKVNALLSDKRVKNLFPARMKFLWGFKAFDKEGTALELVAIKVSTRDGKSPLSGDIISDARKEFDQRGGSGSPQISMSMTPEAAQIWKRLTKDNIGKSIAIVLDNSVYSFPTVQSEIGGGNSSISGNFTVREADDLVNILKAGKLPAPARIVSEETVGATLGAESINAGFLSFVVAIIVVMLYVMFYYSKAGVVAVVALFANMFFIVGILASLGAVLTLPGIAGIVLTIGLSVDANILVFERIREELREGKGIQLAIKDGFSHALSSILDSNITTLLLGVILFAFGTGPIQGFATTLIIGILSSLFCALFITRMIFDGMLNRNKSISFSVSATENLLRHTKIDFVGNRKWYYAFSGLIIAAGIFFYIKNDGFKMGVDFKGGRSYIVRYDKEYSLQDVRNVLTESFGEAPEIKTFGSSNQQKITTTYLIEDNSEDAESKVEVRLNEGLKKLGGTYKVMSSQKVGETVSRDIKTKAVWSILFSCMVMFIYIFIRFKRWQFGLGAVAALFHDVLVVLSFYTICDGFLPFSLEIDQHFIAAILTVMGYSMTDTVVVFDRIREYLSNKKQDELKPEERNTIINYALNSTLSRTINTSAITFFVLLGIFIFGGEVIRGFAFALLIGIVIGTYSSLCIATPVVVDFDKKNKGLNP